MSSCCSNPSACGCTCTCGKYTFVNLTGTVVRIYDPSLMKVINADYAQLDIGFDPKLFNKLATMIIKPDVNAFYDKHVKMTSHVEGDAGCHASFTMYTHKYTGASYLPEPAENVLYIVPEMIQRTYPDRLDLITPYKPVQCVSDPTVIGYCGFYGFVDSTSDPDDSKLSYTIPSQVIGNINNIVDVSITFSETIPDGQTEPATFTVTYSPVNCQCVDESVDPGIITGSGTSRSITGTVAQLNHIFNEKFEVVLPSEPSTGTITFVIEGKTHVIEISTLELSVDWENVTNKPNVVLYDNVEDADGTNLELGNDDGKVSVFSM